MSNKKLKLAHFNLRSLFPKFDAFVDLINFHHLDIVCLSETWLTPDVTDQAVYISGFKMIRKDRGARGGGIGIYVRDSINSKVEFTDLQSSVSMGC